MGLLFKNATVYIGGKLSSCDLLVEEDRIKEIAPAGTLSGEAIDLTGRYVIPGCVDIHTHGCLGFDFSAASADEMRQMLRRYLRCGITSVVPTLLTDTKENMLAAARRVAEVASSQREDEATVLGVHLEGPFLGLEKKGAHNPDALMPPSEEFLAELDSASGGRVVTLTVDPLLNGASEMMRRHRNRLHFSLGHTACGYNAALEAFADGADRITHTFNAMNGIHHREPGLIGAAADSGAFAELICDGYHVHPSAVRMLFSIFGERTVLVSDSICASGAPDGVYDQGGLEVFVKDGKATLADGTIAGSSAVLSGCMANAVSFGIPHLLAIKAATENPAAAIGLADRTGVIAPGRAADLLLLDEKLQLLEVYKNGRRV